MADHTLTGLQGNDASGAAINGRYTYTIWGNWRNPNNLSLNLARNPAAGTAGISIKLNQKSNVLVFGCEGDTDEEMYQKLISQ